MTEKYRPLYFNDIVSSFYFINVNVSEMKNNSSY